MCMLPEFSQKSQEEMMKWMFKNEDKVWATRGGRPGEETLPIFLGFVTPAPPANLPPKVIDAEG